jgi:hypothetical protein
LQKHIKPLDRVTDFDIWLDKVDQPVHWKKSVQEAYDQLSASEMDDFWHKMHGKREPYFLFKYMRGINGLSFQCRARFGPATTDIEESLVDQLRFAIDLDDGSGWMPHFLKGCNNEEKIAYMSQLPDVPCVQTDFSSFEGSFDKNMIRICETQLFIHMLKHTDQNGLIADFLKATSKAHVKNPHLTYVGPPFRMSGDMWTSIFNGFANLMLMKFVAAEMKWEKLQGFVEGDDGLFLIGGDLPPDSLFQKLGFKLKLEKYERPCEAGFCHLHWAGERAVVDPRTSLLKCVWTMSNLMHSEKHLKDLAVAKAFSLIMMAPGNPITASFARAMLRLYGFSGSWSPKCLEPNKWWGKQLIKNFDQSLTDLTPTLGQRMMVEKLFNISLAQQYRCEEYFDQLQTLTPNKTPFDDNIREVCPYTDMYYARVLRDHFACE